MDAVYSVLDFHGCADDTARSGGPEERRGRLKCMLSSQRATTTVRHIHTRRRRQLVRRPTPRHTASERRPRYGGRGRAASDARPQRYQRRADRNG